MRIAWLNLRYTIPERVQAFSDGCKRLGYAVEIGCPRRFDPNDLFLSWNRIGHSDHCARLCEEVGMRVLITENASWGNGFLGRHWYTLSKDYHNVATGFPEGGSERWDRLGVDLEPWREDGGETVILPSRGIGPVCNRMPSGWVERARACAPQGTACRTRSHPGRNGSEHRNLGEDLKRTGRVITWGSGAAIKALMWGIKVESHMPNWIGQQNNTDAGRLAMFRRLAWAQWEVLEIATGEPMARLLAFQSESCRERSRSEAA